MNICNFDLIFPSWKILLTKVSVLHPPSHLLCLQKESQLDLDGARHLFYQTRSVQPSRVSILNVIQRIVTVSSVTGQMESIISSYFKLSRYKFNAL